MLERFRVIERLRLTHDWVAARLFQTSYLLTFVVWLLWLWTQSLGVLDVILSPIFAVIASAITFPLAALCLLLLAVPVLVVLSMFENKPG